jgi:hypothetical protein
MAFSSMLTFDYLCRAALKWPRGPLVPEVTPSPAGQVFDIDAQEFDTAASETMKRLP